MTLSATTTKNEQWRRFVDYDARDCDARFVSVADPRQLEEPGEISQSESLFEDVSDQLAIDRTNPTPHSEPSEENKPPTEGGPPEGVLEKLNDRQRTAIVFHCLQGLSLKQTAKEMGRSPGAVSDLCRRGKAKIANAHPCVRSSKPSAPIDLNGPTRMLRNWEGRDDDLRKYFREHPAWRHRKSERKRRDKEPHSTVEANTEFGRFFGGPRLALFGGVDAQEQTLNQCRSELEKMSPAELQAELRPSVLGQTLSTTKYVLWWKKERSKRAISRKRGTKLVEVGVEPFALPVG